MRLRVLAFLLLLGPLAGCSGPGQFVWFSDLPPNEFAPPQDFVIHTGDTISVRVLGREEMTVKQHVRSDGRIVIPLIGEVDARGKRPAALRSEMEARLKDFIVSPSVILNVDEVLPMTIVLLGEVQRPGAYPLEPYTGIAHALAVGGGLTEYARHDRIFVVRHDPKPTRIRFTYEAVSQDEANAATFPLRPGDVIVVE
jgi:polysaccharide export outer membrane protein